MKKLLPIFILIFAVASFGQATVSDLQAKAKTQKLKNLVIKYDKFKDRTIITTKPENLIGSWEGGMAIFSAGMIGRGGQTLLFVQVGTGFQGDTLRSTPDKYVISFESNSKGTWQFGGDTNLYILFDEQRIELRPVADDAGITFDPVMFGINTVERAFYLITRDELQRITSAEKMELKIGNSKPRTWKADWSKRIQALLAVTEVK